MADQPEGQRCETCRYFRKASRNVNTACKRYPPTGSPNDVDTDPDQYSTFPSPNPKSWCGEYAPANPETITEGAATLARLVLLGDLTAARALADKLRE